jgi:hypothetical protein
MPNIFQRSPRRLEFFIYTSQAKVEMLYAQASARRRVGLETELKANLGVAEAVVKGSSNDQVDAELYEKIHVIEKHLRRVGDVGTVQNPRRFIEGEMHARFGIVTDYAASLVFFGGSIERTKVGLIGAPESVVGPLPGVTTNHSMFYYTLRFLHGMTLRADPPVPPQPSMYHSYAEAFDMANNADLPLSADVKFLTPVIHSEPGLIIASPLYVSYA